MTTLATHRMITTPGLHGEFHQAQPVSDHRMMPAPERDLMDTERAERARKRTQDHRALRHAAARQHLHT